MDTEQNVTDKDEANVNDVTADNDSETETDNETDNEPQTTSVFNTDIEELLKKQLSKARADGIIIGAKTVCTIIYGKLEHINIKSTKVDMAKAISDIKMYIDKARYEEENKDTKKKKK